MAAADTIYIRSSSPSLPSPRALFKTSAPGPRTGSHAQQLPTGVASGFSTAASLYRAHRDNIQLPEGTEKKGKQVGKLKPPKKAGKEQPSSSLKDFEYTRSETAQQVAFVPKSKAAQKTTKKKPKSAAIVLNSDEPEASAYFTAPVADLNLSHATTRPTDPLEGPESLEVEPAPRRRRSWTPMKDTERPVTADSAVLPNSNISPARRVPLSELIANFGYAGKDVNTRERTDTGEAITKRRRVELTDLSIPGVQERKTSSKDDAEEVVRPQKPAKRPKVPKKKPQTITALATAAYKLPERPESAQGMVSEFFVAQKEASNGTQPKDHVTSQPSKPKKPRKPRTKLTANDDTGSRAKKTAKPKKARVTFNELDHLPKLYSPTTANQQIKQQDFIFGTSSQLAVEESPTFIRHMQLAIRESELAPGSQAAESPRHKSCTTVPTAPHGTNLSVEQAAKELWCSAARDFKGGVLRDDSGLSNLKAQKRAVVPPGPATSKPDAVPIATDIGSEKTVVDLCNTSPLSPLKAQIATFNSTPKFSRTVHPGQRLSASQPSPPKTESWHDIDEIDDPESPATPSPPRRRATSSPPTIRPLDLNTSGSPIAVALHSTASLKPSDTQWPEISKRLFPRITDSIKAATRSTNPEMPSWHQKILLFDPIVVEDLAAYLNTQGLRVQVRKQKRKGPATKKRGRPRKNVESGPTVAEVQEAEVETVEEELQPWMVQKWCEEHSVCCVLKESLWGGSRKRY